MNAYLKPEKPLGHRAYGSIPHLPNSRRGIADKGLSDQQSAILTVKTRDKHDLVVVQEKLDGSCVSVAKINGEIIPLIRAGYSAKGSNYKQHHVFHEWVMDNHSTFFNLLHDGERVCGEWLYEAHGTIYHLPHEPFVAFDIITGYDRALSLDVKTRCEAVGIVTPRELHRGSAISVESILSIIEPSGHGAIELVEGAVWRLERKGKVDFLGKYVRPEKIDGKYLESISGKEPIINSYK